MFSVLIDNRFNQVLCRFFRDTINTLLEKNTTKFLCDIFQLSQYFTSYIHMTRATGILTMISESYPLFYYVYLTTKLTHLPIRQWSKSYKRKTCTSTNKRHINSCRMGHLYTSTLPEIFNSSIGK